MDFYDTFVDLYLISLGGCVTYNIGGFGYMGYLISAGKYSQCRIRQDALMQPKIKHPCTWITNANESIGIGHDSPPDIIETVENTTNNNNIIEPYFLPSM